MLIPIGLKCLFDNARRVCPFRVDEDDREWVRKAGVIGFGQAMGSNNWEVFVLFDGFRFNEKKKDN